MEMSSVLSLLILSLSLFPFIQTFTSSMQDAMSLTRLGKSEGKLNIAAESCSCKLAAKSGKWYPTAGKK